MVLPRLGIDHWCVVWYFDTCLWEWPIAIIIIDKIKRRHKKHRNSISSASDMIKITLLTFEFIVNNKKTKKTASSPLQNSFVFPLFCQTTFVAQLFISKLSLLVVNKFPISVGTYDVIVGRTGNVSRKTKTVRASTSSAKSWHLWFHSTFVDTPLVEVMLSYWKGLDRRRIVLLIIDTSLRCFDTTISIGQRQ